MLLSPLRFLRVMTVVMSCLFLLGQFSCSKSEPELTSPNVSNPVSDRVKVSIQLNGLTQYLEPMSKAAVALPDTLRLRLTLNVFDTDNKLVYADEQLLSEVGGVIPVEFLIAEGDYHLAFWADYVVYKNNEVSDKAYSFTTLQKIVPASSFNSDAFSLVLRDVAITGHTAALAPGTLSRAVSLLKIASEDDMPENAKRLRYTLSRNVSSLNLLTGKPTVSNSPVSFESPLQSGSPIDVSHYLLPSENFTCTMEVLNDAGETVVSCEMTDVSVVANIKTVLSGIFFNPKQPLTFSLTLAEDWGEDKTYVIYPHHRPVAPGTTIVFSDKAFEAYCLARFDADGDGAIQYAEIENVQRLTVRADVASFEGLAYFSSLRSFCYVPVDPAIQSDLFTEIGKLPRLNRLVVESLSLSDGIPGSVFSLSCLDTLVLRQMNLHGELPTAWSSLPNLEYLNLADNNLTGSLPEEMATLSRLKYIDVRNNRLSGQLSGQLPVLPVVNSACAGGLVQQEGYEIDIQGDAAVLSDILGNISSLENDYIEKYGIKVSPDGNRVTAIGRDDYRFYAKAALFDRICDLTALTTLYISCDTIPERISQLEQLELLAVSGVSGESSPLPEGLFSLSRLRKLSIQQWRQTFLPDKFDRLLALDSLILINNDFSGGFPQSVLSLSNLRTLDLSGNNLSGEVPFAVLGESAMEDINLSNNKFEGTIDMSADYYSKFVLGKEAKWKQRSGFGFQLLGYGSGWVPKFCMNAFQATGDSGYAYGWRPENLVDGNVNTGWHTTWTTDISGPWPHRITIGFSGVSVKLDSIRIYHRGLDSPQFSYAYGDPKRILLYGYSGEMLPESETLDEWELIASLNSFKPSASSLWGCQSLEDIEYLKKGEGFALPADKSAYRYIKLVVTETWGGVPFVYFMEVDVKGSVIP